MKPITSAVTEPVRARQIEQIGRFASDATRIAMTQAVDALAESGVLNKDGVQMVIEKGDELARRVTEEVAKLIPTILLELAMVMLGHLKVISLGTIKVSVMPEMQTTDCFVQDGVLIGWRDGDLDCWLTNSIPAIPGGTINCLEITKPEGTTYREIAEAMLGVTGTDAELKALLRDRGMTFHLEQVRNLIERTEAKEDTGLLNNGNGNFFPIEDEKGEVFWLNVRRRGRGWRVSIDRFDYAYGWLRGLRAFSRNKV